MPPITSKPTSSPSDSLVTSKPTSSPSVSPVAQETCILITTGTGTYDGGYLDVSVNNGDGYDMVTTPGINYAQDQVVFSKCYVGLLGVQVTNTETNAWGGSIEYSVDGGVTYSAMICDDCTGTVKTTEYIVIDGDDNGVGDTKCLNGSIGNVCILAVSSQPPSPTISPTTSSPTLPQLETVGSDGLPPNVYPLGRCQSDCDNDDDCEVCFICLVYKSIVYRLLFPSILPPLSSILKQYYILYVLHTSSSFI